LFALSAALATYSCMYAFRKPFTVATYAGLEYGNIDLKIWLITAQLCGYALSKFIGIRVISEMKNESRAISIILLCVIAESALFGFAVSDGPFRILFLFINGIPLGMVWGLVFSFLEGRRSTEFLGAGLSTSFIFASGLVKSVGKWLMVELSVSEIWMPFFTGLIFIIPLIFSVWMLNKIPPPSQKDISLRHERKPMSSEQRWKFFAGCAPPLLMLIIAYISLTVLRDIRDNFSAEIWQSLGYDHSPEIFLLSELPIAIAVLFILTVVMFIKNNIQALTINQLIIFAGFMIIGMTTLAFEKKMISGEYWMILIGFGLYMSYIPFNSVLFDRLVAASGIIANSGFLIYLADSFGYLGSITVMIYKNFGQPDLQWIPFLVNTSYLFAFIGMALITISMYMFQSIFFLKSKKQEPSSADAIYNI
jgi:hypothetical protein